jgi:hypothetical protein
MFAVPDPSFVLKDTVGEMYFCNLRCFCVWSVQLATRPNLSEEDKTGVYSLTTPGGKNISSMGLWMWRGGRRPLLLNKEIGATTPNVKNRTVRRRCTNPSPCGANRNTFLQAKAAIWVQTGVPSEFGQQSTLGR